MLPIKKSISFTDLLSDIHYDRKNIDNNDLLELLRKADEIPHQLLPLKGFIHVIDYTKRKHVCMKGPIKNIIGYDAREFLENGLGFSIDLFHKDDFKIYNTEIFNQVAKFLQITPHSEHDKYIFSFTYRSKRSDGKMIQVYQQGTYITCPKTNLPIYGIGVVTDVTQLKQNNCMIFSIDKKNDVDIFDYKNIITSYHYPNAEDSVLTKRETEILKWLSEGLSSKEIATKLFISESTVINHRKNMLRKSNTKNIAQLISYAILKGII